MFGVFRHMRIHSDLLGCIRAHSEAIGSVWTFSKIFEVFWIFESFFNVSGRKKPFSRHNIAAAHLFVKPVIYTVSRFFASMHPAGFSAGRAARPPAGRPAEHPAGCPAGRLSAVPVSSAAPKKKVFDRGGPVWPPRSNAADDRLGGCREGALPP